MPVLLPDAPPVSQGFRLITAKNVLTPAFGGDEQEILRKGTRYEFAFDMGEMDYVEALDWADLMIEGDTVVMAVHQPGLDTGAPGAPVVNGGGQVGSSLAVRGLANGYPIRKGQFLTHLTNGGRRYLYRCRTTVQAVGGATVIPLYSLLRRPPLDGEVIEIAQPELKFDGEIDKARFRVGDSWLLTLECGTQAERQLEDNADWRLNNAFHQLIWPGELGLSFVDGVTRKKEWRSRPENPGVFKRMLKSLIPFLPD